MVNNCMVANQHTNKLRDTLFSSILRCDLRRCLAKPIPSLDQNCCMQQGIHHLVVSLGRCHMQRSVVHKVSFVAETGSQRVLKYFLL